MTPIATSRSIALMKASGDPFREVWKGSCGIGDLQTELRFGYVANPLKSRRRH